MFGSLVICLDNLMDEICSREGAHGRQDSAGLNLRSSICFVYRDVSPG